MRTAIVVIALCNSLSIFAEQIYQQTFSDDALHPIQETINDLVVENEHPAKRISRHAFGGYGTGIGYPALPSK